MTVTPASRPARARLVLFWDYDTQWGADADARRGLPPAEGAREFACTDRLLELHARFAVPACFAVVGAAALPGARPYHDPAQIRELHAAGHEVASHAFRHEWLPALGPSALRATLRDSRDSLAQCIGADVTTFVPPYNQPFDFARVGAPSRSERRACPGVRTDVPALCEALAETGYRTCRLAYRSALDRLRTHLHGTVRDRRPGRIGAITCLRLRAPCGFAGDTRRRLDEAVGHGELLVAYGHPHSLATDNAQGERHLVPFLARARALADAGALDLVLPRDLIAADGPRSSPARHPVEAACGSAS